MSSVNQRFSTRPLDCEVVPQRLLSYFRGQVNPAPGQACLAFFSRHEGKIREAYLPLSTTPFTHETSCIAAETTGARSRRLEGKHVRGAPSLRALTPRNNVLRRLCSFSQRRCSCRGSCYGWRRTVQGGSCEERNQGIHIVYTCRDIRGGLFILAHSRSLQ